MPDVLVDRPDLTSQVSDLLVRVQAGRASGLLLVGARGSGRSSLATVALSQAKLADAVMVLRDVDLSSERMMREIRELQENDRPFIACASPLLAEEITERGGSRTQVLVVPVPPLTREEVTDAITRLLGAPASAQLVSVVWELSGGNPAIVRMLVEGGLTRGAIQHEDDAAQLIAPLAMSRHDILALPIIAGLAVEDREALARLALIEPAPVSLAEHVVDSEALAALTDAGLVQVVPAQGTRPRTAWIPAQVIARQLREEASSPVQQQVHAVVLEALPSGIAGRWQALGRSRSLLWWYRQGGTGTPPVSPVEAARVANHIHLWAVAIELCTYALAGGDDPGVLRERAFARRFSGDSGGALDDLTRLDAQDHDASSVIGIADILHYEIGDAEDALRLLREKAVSAASGASSRELNGAMVAHLAYGGRFSDCEEAHRALPPGSLRERGRADVAHAMTWSHCGKATQALRRLYRYQFMPTVDAPKWFAEELQGALFVCLLQAHGPRRTLTATKILGATEVTPFVRFDEVSLMTARISVLLTQGHALEAYRLALSVEAGAEHDRSGLGMHALALGAEAAAYLGDDPASRQLESRYRELPQRAAGILLPNSEAALSAAALIRGDSGAAERTRALAQRLSEEGLYGSALRVAQAGLRVGDVECAELAASVGGMTTGDVNTVFASHGEALKSDAPHGLMRAAEQYLRLGFTLHAAEAFCQAASTADRTGIKELLTEALSRARLLLGLTDVRAPHLALTGQAPVDLSRREREIALLVSQGASNRSIAQALVISVRTVEGHLGRMYAKLGVSGRRELAGHLRRSELQGRR